MDELPDIPVDVPADIPPLDPAEKISQLQEIIEGFVMGKLGSTGDFVEAMSQVQVLEASIALGFSVLWLFWGWKMFKPLTILNFAIAGALIGGMVTLFIEQQNYWWVGMLAGAAVLGALAWPLARIFLTIIALLFGAVLGLLVYENLMLSLHRPDLAQWPWIGMAAGALLLGMFSLIFFRQSIMLLTALQGAGMVVSSSICLLLKIENFRPKLIAGLNSHQAVPVIVAICLAILGFVLQARAAARKAKAAEESADA